jgi:hypothetical protein
MIIKLVWTWSEVEILESLVLKSLAELSLDDAVKVEKTDDAAYKMELGITENPALAIEEESIEFKDMIFQGEVPEYEEIKSMFVSILGDDTEGHGDSCGTGGCGDCSSGCH